MVLDNQLINSPMEFRSKLTLPHRVNFGLEMELDKVDFFEVRDLVTKQIGGNFIVKEDDSLTKCNNAEINTPVLRNTKATWELLKKMGELLKRIDASYDVCSFQINFDGSLLPSDEAKVRFLKLYAMYEDIVYRFSKGEDPTIYGGTISEKTTDSENTTTGAKLEKTDAQTQIAEPETITTGSNVETVTPKPLDVEDDDLQKIEFPYWIIGVIVGVIAIAAVTVIVIKKKKA